MVISKTKKKYGLTVNELAKTCVTNSVCPIVMYNDYYIDREANIYILDTSNEKPNFIRQEPIKYKSKTGIPVYKMKNDLTGKYDNVRADIAYLSTFYGQFTKSAIIYKKSFNWNKCDIDEIKYTIVFGSIKYLDSDTITIYDIIFKRVIINGESSDLFISDHGVVYDSISNTIKRHYFAGKLYHSIKITQFSITSTQNYPIHRLIYIVWNNNGSLPAKENVIDHIDGFRDHNWASNLREVSQLENSRSARYTQNLVDSPWNYEIIHYMCQLMEDPKISGVREIYDKIKEKFPSFDITYSACKHRVYEIKDGVYWSDISKDYNVDEYDKNREFHNHMPVSDEDIHNICRIATSGVKYESNKEMAEKNGLSLGIVNRVLRGQYRTDISSQYNIEYNLKPRRVFSEEQVRDICERFMNGETVMQIARAVDRDRHEISKLIHRKNYPEITSQYNFESVRPDLKYRIPYNPKS